MRNKIIMSVLLVALIASLVLVGCAAPAPAPAPAPTPAPAPAPAPEEKAIHWTAQSTWIKGPGHQELADYFADKINELAGGRLVIDKMYAAGELVGAFETIPATAEGKLDMCHASGYYLTGTLPWTSLFLGTQANYFSYPDEHIGWMYSAGGLEMYQEYIQTAYDLMVFFTGIHAAEPLWSMKPVTKKEDFEGLKLRATGLNMAFYEELGAAVVTMPMGEVVPSLEKGVLDGCEFCVPYSDYPAGLHTVCPYALAGKNHIPTALGFEAFINGDSWRALPDDLKGVVKAAAELTIFRTIHYWNGYQAMVFTAKMIEEGVNINKISPELQAWFNEVGDKLAEGYAAEDPWAKKILGSQKTFIDSYREYQGVLAPCFRD